MSKHYLFHCNISLFSRPLALLFKLVSPFSFSPFLLCLSLSPEISLRFFKTHTHTHWESDCVCLCSVYISCGWVAKASAVTGCQCDLWAHHTLSEPASHTEAYMYTHTQKHTQTTVDGQPKDTHTSTHLFVMVRVTSLSWLLTSPKCSSDTQNSDLTHTYIVFLSMHHFHKAFNVKKELQHREKRAKSHSHWCTNTSKS